MGSSDILSENRLYANASRVWTAANVEDVTVYVVGSGTETDNTKYLNKGSEGTGFVVFADQNFLIRKVRHGGVDKLLGDPIQVAANTVFARSEKQPPITEFVFGILTANTKVQLLVF